MKRHMLNLTLIALFAVAGIGSGARAPAQPAVEGQWGPLRTWPIEEGIHMIVLKNGKVLAYDARVPTQCLLFDPPHCVGGANDTLPCDTDSPTAAGPPDYDLSWHSVDGGGVTFSTGGEFEVSGTIGQPDAGVMAGGDFTLTGGFWFALAPGDCNTDGGVNLFDYSPFEACLAGPADGPLSPECACFDLDGNGTVDLVDFGLFEVAFSGS